MAALESHSSLGKGPAFSFVGQKYPRTCGHDHRSVASPVRVTRTTNKRRHWHGGSSVAMRMFGAKVAFSYHFCAYSSNCNQKQSDLSRYKTLHTPNLKCARTTAIEHHCGLKLTFGTMPKHLYSKLYLYNFQLKMLLSLELCLFIKLTEIHP